MKISRCFLFFFFFLRVFVVSLILLPCCHQSVLNFSYSRIHVLTCSAVLLVQLLSSAFRDLIEFNLLPAYIDMESTTPPYWRRSPLALLVLVVAFLLLAAVPLPAYAQQQTVAQGASFMCAIKRGDGTAMCWGSTTVQGWINPPSTIAFASLSCSSQFVCGVHKVDNTCHCFGMASALTSVGAAPPDAFVKVAVGQSHVCGIRTQDNKLVCWGSSPDWSSLPPTIAATAYSDIVAGFAFSCALRQNDGKPDCWGSSTAIYEGKTGVPAVSFISLFASGGHICGILRDDERVVCWGGANSNGETSVPPTLPPAISLSLSSSHSCALLRNTLTIACWGSALPTTNGVVPPPLPLATSQWAAISVGSLYTCGFPHVIAATTASPTPLPTPVNPAAASGDLLCWGSIDAALIPPTLPLPSPVFASSTSAVSYIHNTCTASRGSSGSCLPITDCAAKGSQGSPPYYTQFRNEANKCMQDPFDVRCCFPACTSSRVGVSGDCTTSALCEAHPVTAERMYVKEANAACQAETAGDVVCCYPSVKLVYLPKTIAPTPTSTPTPTPFSPTPTSTPTPAPTQGNTGGLSDFQSKESSNAGLVIGVVCGVIILLALLAAVVVCQRKRKQMWNDKENRSSLRAGAVGIGGEGGEGKEGGERGEEEWEDARDNPNNMSMSRGGKDRRKKKKQSAVPRSPATTDSTANTTTRHSIQPSEDMSNARGSVSTIPVHIVHKKNKRKSRSKSNAGGGGGGLLEEIGGLGGGGEEYDAVTDAELDCEVEMEVEEMVNGVLTKFRKSMNPILAAAYQKNQHENGVFRKSNAEGARKSVIVPNTDTAADGGGRNGSSSSSWSRRNSRSKRKSLKITLEGEGGEGEGIADAVVEGGGAVIVDGQTRRKSAFGGAQHVHNAVTLTTGGREGGGGGEGGRVVLVEGGTDAPLIEIDNNSFKKRNPAEPNRPAPSVPSITSNKKTSTNV